MTADSSHSLEALESQWRASKAPKLGLQLAEEYRRRDDLPAAIKVLEAGLDAHPEHMSSRVALSRYLVDRGLFEDALEHLERIVRVDPVHLVANKLLVRTNIGLGRMDEARDKLDIYEMLGEGDADIEGLRGELDESLAAGGKPRVTSLVEEAPESQAAPDDDDAFLVGPTREAESSEAVTPKAPKALASPSSEEPFGSVWAAQETSTYWNEVGDEGIFALPKVEVPRADDAGHDEDTGDQAVEPGVGPESEPDEEVAEEVSTEEFAESTATLGSLYLEQGHADKAAETFNAVLALDPDNEAARRGLASIEVAASEPIEFAVPAQPAQTSDPALLNERKKAMLIAYRDRLRRASEVTT